MNTEQELNELMGLVQDYGVTCMDDTITTAREQFNELNAVESRLRALLAERDALKEDKDRVDWMQGLRQGVAFIHQGWGSFLYGVNCYIPYSKDRPKECVRTAIDEARKKVKD